MTMKNIRVFLLTLLVLALLQPAWSQNKKFDGYYAAGSFEKASASLKKLKSSIVKKMGQTNPYMPGLYMRQAKLNLALGVLVDFDKFLQDAIKSSLDAYG